MLEIILFPSITLLMLFFLGYGLTLPIIPKELRKYSLWLSPWFAVIFLILTLVGFSLAGIAVQHTSRFLLIVLSALSGIAFYKTKERYYSFTRIDFLIFLFVAITIFIGLFPLTDRHRFLTTVSLGNNDAVNYALSADYAVDNSINATFKHQTITSIDHDYQRIYRWGPPLLTAFFLDIFGLRGYQFSYLLQVILFALTIPLVYVLFSVVYRWNWTGLLVCLMLTAFNVNLLYLLYHNFFGQIIFLGFESILLIFFFAYFKSEQLRSEGYTPYDFLIGLTMGALYFAYHEGAVFIITPLFFYLLLSFFTKRDIVAFFRTLGKIAMVVFAAGSVAVVLGSLRDLETLLYAVGSNEIGWKLFRAVFPYVNPFELMGFFSLHSYTSLPIPVALSVSAVTLLVVLLGILQSHNKLLTVSFLSVYAFFYFWFWLGQPNFFLHYRAMTYALPLLIVFFAAGVDRLFSYYLHKRFITTLVLFGLLALELNSSLPLIKRMVNEQLTVDETLVSLQGLDLTNYQEKIYTEHAFARDSAIWRSLWMQYFLYPKELILTPLSIPDSALVLAGKPSPEIKSSHILLDAVVWENRYFNLARLCNSEECLLKRPEDLSRIIFDQTEFAESLLISGWSTKENGNRWASGKRSTLQLVSKIKDSFRSLVFRAHSLAEPQTIEVLLDGESIARRPVSTEWKEYRIPLETVLAPGVHKVSFSYLAVYRPIDIMDSADRRELSVNFSEIRFE